MIFFVGFPQRIDSIRLVPVRCIRFRFRLMRSDPWLMHAGNL